MPRTIFALLIFTSFVSLAFSFGCAPPVSTDDLPELNEETIRERINGAFLRKVPEENAAAEPINWTFDEDEPKEIQVVEKQLDGARAVIVLDIKTATSPRSRDPRQLAGQIRTHWELESGWALRRWQIVRTENVSMKYRNLPKPPAQNSNR